jgi:hypothetical protein
MPEQPQFDRQPMPRTVRILELANATAESHGHGYL